MRSHDGRDGFKDNGRAVHAYDRDVAERGMEVETMTSRELREYGIEDLGADDVSCETVQGYDDVIASQMNTWQRLSRKRRFMGRP